MVTVSGEVFFLFTTVKLNRCVTTKNNVWRDLLLKHLFSGSKKQFHSSGKPAFICFEGFVRLNHKLNRFRSCRNNNEIQISSFSSINFSFKIK